MLSYTTMETALINDANTYSPTQLSNTEQNTLVQYYRFLNASIKDIYGNMPPAQYKQIIAEIMEDVMHHDPNNIFVKKYYRYAIEHPESSSAKLKGIVSWQTYRPNIITICSFIIRHEDKNNE